MSSNGWLQIGLLLALVFLTIKPLGLYIACVFEGQRTFLSPILGPLERLPCAYPASMRAGNKAG